MQIGFPVRLCIDVAAAPRPSEARYHNRQLLRSPQVSKDRPAQGREVAAAALDRATPLHCAAVVGSRPIVEMLLGCGASAGLVTAAGERPCSCHADCIVMQHTFLSPHPQLLLSHHLTQTALGDALNTLDVECQMGSGGQMHRAE